MIVAFIWVPSKGMWEGSWGVSSVFKKSSLSAFFRCMGSNHPCPKRKRRSTPALLASLRVAVWQYLALGFSVSLPTSRRFVVQPCSYLQQSLAVMPAFPGPSLECCLPRAICQILSSHSASLSGASWTFAFRFRWLYCAQHTSTITKSFG